MSRHPTAPARVPGRPPRYKMALLSWVGAYVVITAILAALGPLMAPWPLPLRTLLLSVLMVIAMTWLVVPWLTRLFQGWLVPAPSRPAAPPGPPTRPASPTCSGAPPGPPARPAPRPCPGASTRSAAA
jgi:hypothetical protein